MGIFSKPRLDIRSEVGFTVLYKRYAPLVFNVCYDYLLDKALSDNLTADIFISVWDRRETLYHNSLSKQMEWKHYLNRAAKNKVVDHLRNTERLEGIKEVIMREIITFENTTEDQVDFHELINELSLAIEQLPSKCQEIFRMSREDGLSNKEIATMMKISEHSVKKQIAIALKKLREQLSDYNTPKRASNL